MRRDLGRRARLTGVSATAFGELPGSSALGLHAEAAHAALGDAGVGLRDVDGLLCAYSFVEPHMMLSSVVAEYLGVRPAYTTALQLGGATGCGAVMHAAMLVEAGRCRHVLVVMGDNRLTGMSRDDTVALLSAVGHAQFEVPYGPTIPALYALVANRYMHEHGATPEHLAHIAVTMRRHAGLHPGAHMRAPVSVADVLASRLIAAPLHLLDCCLVSDGACAVVVSAADAARDTRPPGVALIGSGQGHTHEHLSQAPSLTDFGCHDAAGQALGEAGVRPARSRRRGWPSSTATAGSSPPTARWSWPAREEIPMSAKPLPRITAETRPYWEACAAGELRYPWCPACRQPQFYPRVACARCGGGAPDRGRPAR